VPADQTSLVEDPTARIRVFELEHTEELDHRRTVKLVLATAARKGAQRAPNADHSHDLILSVLAGAVGFVVLTLAHPTLTLPQQSRRNYLCRCRVVGLTVNFEEELHQCVHTID